MRNVASSFNLFFFVKKVVQAIKSGTPQKARGKRTNTRRAPTLRPGAPRLPRGEPTDRGPLPIHAQDVGEVRCVAMHVGEVRRPGVRKRLRERGLARDRQHAPLRS